ncbi:hypothetical protein L596_024886 [Steinernema carpocapsae]|uniref:Uncharacterized protein n=1 Tax=Steinernema carpocapsae TaxID=34508 RepID=A0A4U5M644_STECR|nr:hypothetical protein L596_024886 [Steinernema carpocapsae]
MLWRISAISFPLLIKTLFGVDGDGDDTFPGISARMESFKPLSFLILFLVWLPEWYTRPDACCIVGRY